MFASLVPGRVIGWSGLEEMSFEDASGIEDNIRAVGLIFSTDNVNWFFNLLLVFLFGFGRSGLGGSFTCLGGRFVFFLEGEEN